MIAAVVLAAGGSRRMGRPKQLVEWEGRPLLAHVLAQVATWPIDQVVVVLGYEAELILDEIDFGDALVVLNDEWQEGLASSLRAGLATLDRDPRAEAALVALGDQPEVDREVVERLVAEYRGDGHLAVVPRYRYTVANPILLDRAIWARVMSLKGDQGAKTLLQAHPHWVKEVWVDHLPPADVDRPSDLPKRRRTARGSPDPGAEVPKGQKKEG